MSIEDRTVNDVREWAEEKRRHEYQNAPEKHNTSAAGMTRGALETLEALLDYLDGDDEA